MFEISIGIILGFICFMFIKVLMKDALTAEIESRKVINKVKKLNHSQRQFKSFTKEGVNL